MIRFLRDYPNPFAAILEQLRYRAERNKHQPDKDWDELETFHEPLANEDQQTGYLRAIEDMKKVFCGDTEKVQKKLVDLYTWVPECGFPLEGVSPWTGRDIDPEDYDGCPFFTEQYLYDLMGKEDARTILALINQVAEAAGVDRMSLRRDIHAIHERQEAQRLAEEQRRVAVAWRRDFWVTCVHQSHDVEKKRLLDGRCLIPLCHWCDTDKRTEDPPRLLCPRHTNIALSSPAKNSYLSLQEGDFEDDKECDRLVKRLIGWVCEHDDEIYTSEKARRPPFPKED